VATLIDDSGLSARVGADQLGHARPSMTQDVYMSRGRIHAEVAAILDQKVGISVEKRRIANNGVAAIAPEVARGGIEPPTFRFSG
jgi:hypothetical protein